MRVADEAGADLNTRLQARPAGLRAALPEITALALATRSGLVLAGLTDQAADTDALAALGADLLTSAESAARGLAGGEPREATVRGPQGHLIAVAAGASAVLLALTDALTPAASVLPDLREAARELGEALEA